MIVANRRPPQIERCPYLALHDDESTCLAFASPWNYCYHAAPPASILLSHQEGACLRPQYVDCTVLASNKWGRLPRSLRGKAGARIPADESSRRFTRLILFVLLVVILVLVVWFPEPIFTFF